MNLVDEFTRLSELPPELQERELEALEAAEAAELRSLLSASLEAGDFLESSAGISMSEVVGGHTRSRSRPPELDLAPGERVGNFKILRHLGSGGASRVYLAQDEVLHRTVALKIMQGQSHEGRLRAELEHDNIVRLYEEREDLIPGHVVLVMEYIEGPTLKEYLDAVLAQPHLDQWELLRSMWADASNDLAGIQHHVNFTFALSPVQVIHQIGMRFLEAIEYSHKKGVLHLDFKPANVIIAPPYARPVVTDFNVSLSRRMGPRGEGTLGGTLEYMAPEQRAALITGNANGIDERADLYSIGAVLKYHKSVIAPDSRQFRAEYDAALSSALDRIIARATLPDPEDRYPSATAMYEEFLDLQRYLPAAQRAERELSARTRRLRLAACILQALMWSVVWLRPSLTIGLAPLGLVVAVYSAREIRKSRLGI